MRIIEKLKNAEFLAKAKKARIYTSAGSIILIPTGLYFNGALTIFSVVVLIVVWYLPILLSEGIKQ